MLELHDISKSFETTRAVDGLSFQAPEGTIFGFLGPNGAGKTTTMRMVLDILRPDSGSITWRGEPISDSTRQTFGYLPEDRGLYQRMRVGEQLMFFARLYGVEKQMAEDRIQHWLTRFGIWDRVGSRLEELSRGNQQKVQVLAALLHEPDLSLLDEPFTGLDPINVELMEDVLVSLRDRGKTVLFSSHRLEQVEELCDDIAIIANGRLRLAGNLTRIRDEATRRIVQVRTTSGETSVFDGMPLRPLSPSRDYLRFALLDGADAQQVLASLVSRDRVELFALERPSLEDIFLETTQGGKGVQQARFSPAGSEAVR